MTKKILALLFMLLLLFIAAFLFYDGGKDYDDVKISTGHGPEDLALDISNPSQPRIFISCSKRKGDHKYGKIQAFDINTAEVYDMNLIDYDPAPFRPHGIYLVEEDSTQYLYVITHEKESEESEIIEDKIIKFSVNDKNLQFVSTVGSSKSNPLLDRTNDLHVTDNGTVFCTNPTDVGFSEVPANVVVIRPNGSSDIVTGGLLYPNGLYVEGNNLYVATAQENILYQYELNQNGIAVDGSKKEVAHIAGGDNITRYGNQLVVAHHPNIYKFVTHSMWDFDSPSGVTSYDIITGTSKMIYGPSAKDISASSTGLIYNGQLYIAQVFEDYIVKVPLSDLN
tara:strand:+ start:272 stop:1285 length:1014 start_codon:yes stop_codon:yes gene_type:complete